MSRLRRQIKSICKWKWSGLNLHYMSENYYHRLSSTTLKIANEKELKRGEKRKPDRLFHRIFVVCTSFIFIYICICMYTYIYCLDIQEIYKRSMAISLDICFYDFISSVFFASYFGDLPVHSVFHLIHSSSSMK